MTQMSRGFEEVTLSFHKSLVSATMLPTVKGPELISDPTSNRIVSAADRSKKKKRLWHGLLVYSFLTQSPGIFQAHELSISVSHSTCHSTYVYLPAYLPTYIYVSMCLSTYLLISFYTGSKIRTFRLSPRHLSQMQQTIWVPTRLSQECPITEKNVVSLSLFFFHFT